MKALQTNIIFLLMLLMTAASGFAQESQCPRVPLLEAVDAMVSDSEVTVTEVPANWPGTQEFNPQYYYEFEPVGIEPQNGFIIYPGGNVDVRAYAVLARAIAKSGFLVALVPMPTCLVLFGVERADAIIDNNPEITTWAIGGHSFAATGACWYAYNKTGTFTNSSKIKGVVLWAGIPDPSQPLTDMPIKALSIWATNNPRTNEEVIDGSKPNLPPDTRFIALQGANHAQFGWYGETATDYDYYADDGSDLPADISRQMQTDLMFSYTVNFLDSLTPDTFNIPAAEDEVTADDGSTWAKVSLPGFADRNNTDIVSLTPFKGNLYALTRNDVSGFELWKTDPGQNWYRLHVQGLTDQNNYYGYLQHPDLTTPYPFEFFPPQQYNPNMNIWADMIEFNGHLYVALSTGYMGSALFSSRGAAIWRTDDVEWEPLIGGHDPVAQGTLSAISSCADDDGSSTALFTDDDDNQTWVPDSLTGCIIDVDAEFTAATHGQTGVSVPGKRLFRIEANTANQLTVQQQEKAATIQPTRCDEYLNGGGDTGRPRNNMPAVITGAAYSITCGDHSRGFGDMWDKSIIDFEILSNELYASIGLNTDKGARVMKTSDGLTWVADSPYSFDNIHGQDWHDGSAIEPCDKRKGQAVSSSATKMVKTNITGEETLLIGGTGTNGCNGVGARVYRRDDSNLWTPIVDVLVDENTTGSNENGFGYDSGGDFFLAAFQTWSWLEYLDTLFVGLQKIEGGNMIYATDSAAEEDGAWTLSMGGTDNPNPDDTSPNPTLNGFGDVLNTGVFLHNHNDIIYAGTMVTNQSLYYRNPINGADLWQGTDTDGSINWSRIVGDGFGDQTVMQFQSFTNYDKNMYMVAASVNSSNMRGNEPENYTGAVVYRLANKDAKCELYIKHKKIQAEKLTKPKKIMLHITGSEGFDIFGSIDLGPLSWQKVSFNKKKNRLKIKAIVPAGLASGIIPVKIGNCFGEIEITGSEG